MMNRIESPERPRAFDHPTRCHRHATLILILVFGGSISADDLDSSNESLAAGIARTEPRLPPWGIRPELAIDLLLEIEWRQRQIQPSPRCNDDCYVRRVYLDLIGRIPNLMELDSFLADTDSNKREQLANRLVASAEHARHMREIFDVVLMGRGSERSMRQRREEEWHAYLERCFAENRPWDQVAREILLARPQSKRDRGSVWYLYERKNNYQEIAEAISRGIFGCDIQCAQCHDHPLASEIEQKHYWGLVAFFNRGKNDKSEYGPLVTESAIGGFHQFTDLSGESQPNLLTFLDSVIVDEKRPAENEKESDSDDNYVLVKHSGQESNAAARVPKFSRRRAFADNVLQNHTRVARAMVNRVWALLMGRGLVHPVDEMDSMHPPSHPRLLDWLARDFEQNDYDVRRLVLGIVNSRAYQLNSIPTGVAAPDDSFAFALEKPLTAEAFYRSMEVAVGGQDEEIDPTLMQSFRDLFPELSHEDPVPKINQALFLSNHADIHRMVGVRDDSLAGRLLAMKSHQRRISTAYRAILGRSPDDEELAAILAFLTQREASLPSAVEQFVWALLTSAEFRVNH